MDKIFIRALKTEAIIGIFDWERQVKQTIVIDIELSGDIRKAALTDSITDTLNYKGVAKRVLTFVQESRFHLVETLAEHVSMLILEEFGVTWVSVVLSKPGAIRNSRDVGVALERDRSTLDTWRAARLGQALRTFMPNPVVLDQPLSWRHVAAVAEGAPLVLSEAARQRIRAARGLVESIVAKGIRAYGVNTGVGALCDVIVEPSQLRHLSRNIVMSHAVGVGPPLRDCEVRAIMAAAVNNFAHGYSGLRLDTVERLGWLLTQDWTPEVPAQGSVGYLSHMAHIALVLLGEGHVHHAGMRRRGAEALRVMGAEPWVPEAKEGLSMVNGTPCVAGLTALACLRAERLLNWADVISAMSFENLHGQLAAFDAEVLALRASPAILDVGQRLQSILEGSAILAASVGRHTQDSLSLRSIPQVHGAARDTFARTAAAVDAELLAATDNPLIAGTEEEPRALSAANAVGAAIGLGADALGVAVAEIAAMSERRIDRLVNPLVSGLPAFLASDSGAASGFMIAQYTAVSLIGENRRLAAPASLDGGITSGLQEDHLCHATPAALKLLKILDNAEFILSIELLAATQAYDLQAGSLARAPNTDIVYRTVRGHIPHYRDDRPLAGDIERARAIIREPTAVDFETEGDAEDGPEFDPAPARPRPRRRPTSAAARKTVKPA